MNPALANGDLTASALGSFTVKNLEEELVDAADVLKSKWTLTSTINPLNIQVSPEKGGAIDGENTTSRTGYIDDLLIGSDKNDTITGHSGNDYILGNSGQDTLDGGTGNDTFLIQGEDDAYDIFKGGDGEDTILGSDTDDTIRIDGGGGGENILAGTGEGDTLDLTETTLERIQHIELEEKDDILRLDSDSLKNVRDITIDGGGGDDSIEGTERRVHRRVK